MMIAVSRPDGTAPSSSLSRILSFAPPPLPAPTSFSTTWTPQDDNQLIALVRMKNPPLSWSEIGDRMERRKGASECLKRWYGGVKGVAGDVVRVEPVSGAKKASASGSIREFLQLSRSRSCTSSRIVLTKVLCQTPTGYSTAPVCTTPYTTPTNPLHPPPSPSSFPPSPPSRSSPTLPSLSRPTLSSAGVEPCPPPLSWELSSVPKEE